MDPHHDPSWEVLSRLPRSAERHVPTGAYIGKLAAVGAAGELLVECEAAAPGRSLAARTTVPVTEQDLGREVVLMFEQADPGRPIIMGLLQPAPGPARAGAVAVQRDGESLTLTADREIVLRCGEASITLTRAGKVLIRGAYLLSRSSGVNRIKGGSVQIN
jgi:hypothetical protein